MASPEKITSIKDIRERQLEIKRELDVSKDAAVHTLQTASNEAKSFVLRDVVLPAAGIALAGFLTAKALGYFFAKHPQETEETPVPRTTTHQPTGNMAAFPERRQVTTQPTTSRKQPVYQSLLRLGTLLIPAGQAIIEVIQEERNK